MVGWGRKIDEPLFKPINEPLERDYQNYIVQIVQINVSFNVNYRSITLRRPVQLIFPILMQILVLK